MSYRNTFIQIAPDSQATTGLIPESTRQTTPIHMLQHQLLTEKPYHYTHEDLVLEVHLIRLGISDEERHARGEEIRHELFRKEHPCLRASALTKQYGWGAHYNEEGKIASRGIVDP